MAESMSPILENYASPVLEELHGAMRDVASASAAPGLAKIRARQQEPEQRGRSDAASTSNKQEAADALERAGAGSVVSPVDAASHLQANQPSTDQPANAAPDVAQAVDPQSALTQVNGPVNLQVVLFSPPPSWDAVALVHLAVVPQQNIYGAVMQL